MSEYDKEMKLSVKRAAKFLDKRTPGWFTKVDTHTVDQANSTACVCAQVYGVLPEDSSNPNHWYLIGFEFDRVFPENLGPFSDGTRFWKKQIEKRMTHLNGGA